MASLQNESAIIQKEINKINDLISQTKEIHYNESPDMLSYLIRFRQMSDTIEAFISKQLRRKNNIS